MAFKTKTCCRHRVLSTRRKRSTKKCVFLVRVIQGATTRWSSHYGSWITVRFVCTFLKKKKNPRIARGQYWIIHNDGVCQEPIILVTLAIFNNHIYGPWSTTAKKNIVARINNIGRSKVLAIPAKLIFGIKAENSKHRRDL